MNFQKNSKGEGRVISDPKNFVADFSVPNGYFSFLNFWKKRGWGSLLSEKFCYKFLSLSKKTHHSFPRREGGGSEDVSKFSENS